MRILLHQQPVAKDLREVSAALKMISDMERIGDQAADIADLSKFIEANHVEVPELIGSMAEMTVRMVTESIDAFVKKDLKLCRKVIDDDDQVDDAFNQVKEELAKLMYQNLDAKAGLDLLMTAKYMERIGDHAVNIAEWVEYALRCPQKQRTSNGRQSGLTKKIFKSTVLVSAMILILGSALVMGILYRYFGKQLDGELEKRGFPIWHME